MNKLLLASLFVFFSARSEISLHTAVINNDLPLVKRLLQEGLSPDPLDEDGRTPLHVAIRLKRSEIAKFLFTAGATAPAVTPHEARATPLHCAAQNGDKAAVYKLLKSGADVNAVNFYGFTPLHYATKFGHYGIMEDLLKGNANPNAQDWSKQSPLIKAVGNGDLRAVKILIRYKADVNMQDEDLFTALHYAAHLNHTSIVEFLLRSGADRTIMNIYADTPFDYATANGNAKIAEALKNEGLRP